LDKAMADEIVTDETSNAASRDIRRAAVRTIFSVGIALLFLLVLMVAALQQQVAANLDQGVSYSTAHARVWAGQDWRELLLKGEVGLARQRREAEAAGRELAELREALAASNSKVATLASSIASSHLCPAFETPAPADTSLWGIVYQCWSAGKAPEAVRAEIKALAGSPGDPTNITTEIARAEAGLKDRESQISATEASITAERERGAGVTRLEEQMQDVVILDKSLLGMLRLTWIPPATMQIVLSFVSGLFGSLLVTLVLAVYPNNDLHFTGSDSYWNRILLGGLIAVGVYVVIGGGLAVLGAKNGTPDGGTNFLSFCAIGMLAGMFSDKFAGWLSDNAQKLTAGNRGDDAPSPPPGEG
jgi:hypothetical protein